MQRPGKEVYAVNKDLGLAAASTQKVFTAIAAFDLLGPSFRFTTSFSINDEAQKTMVVSASGDPTFGSNHWTNTNESSILDNLIKGLSSAGIEPSTLTNIAFINPGYSLAQVPEGWIWQDIGNYYGASAHFFNWRENQFDILFKTGASVGDSCFRFWSITNLP
jgi:D-alanyl-D-alanine carboxypeptidase/D-alanyl-D-alanine-endopeptidase (penicillin-binding protein 4)